MTDQLVVWTIYRFPADHPDNWVLRGFEITPHGAIPGATCVIAPTLDEVRAALPPGLTRMSRAPEDDPVIYEVWI